MEKCVSVETPFKTSFSKAPSCLSFQSFLQVSGSIGIGIMINLMKLNEIYVFHAKKKAKNSNSASLCINHEHKTREITKSSILIIFPAIGAFHIWYKCHSLQFKAQWLLLCLHDLYLHCPPPSIWSIVSFQQDHKFGCLSDRLQ